MTEVKKDRPSYTGTRALYHRILSATGWIIILATLVYTAYQYPALPDSVPIHFNHTGEADRMGHRILIWLLPVLAAAMYGSIAALAGKPHLFNYAVTITPENAQRQYAMAAEFVLVVNLLCTVLICFLQYQSIAISLGQQSGLHTTALWILLDAITAVLLTYIARSALRG